MTRAKSQESATAAMVRVLAVLLAALLWVSVVVERPGRTTITVPVRVERIPAGLSLASPPPGEVEVTVSGPRILLCLLPYRGVTCRLDLSGAPAGDFRYGIEEDGVPLPDHELRVVRVFPDSVPLTLAGRN